MEFIYNNKETGTFAEFSVDSIGDELSPSDAIDSLMQIIKSFDDTKGIYLPSALLKLLTEEELDIFMTAAYSKELCKQLEQMFYAVQYDLVVVDEFKTKYRVEYIGKSKSVISLDTLDNLEIFNIPSSMIKNGTIDIRECKEEVFGV